METTRRLTRSQVAAMGQTPLVELPAGRTPATRRRAAKEAPTPRAALFDLTNAAEEAPELLAVDETKPVVAELPQQQAAVAVQQEEQHAEAEQEVEEGEIAQVETVAEAAQPETELPAEDMLSPEESAHDVAPPAEADEPPATPPQALLPTPARSAPAPTPTGLGLSSLAPMSPLNPTALMSANTPAVTPLHGVPSTQAGKAYDTLLAAAKAFTEQGTDKSTDDVREPLSGGGSGFGSPLKVTESPAVSVSICGAVVPSPGMEEVCSGSPAGGDLGMPSPAAPSPAPMSPEILGAHEQAAQGDAQPMDMVAAEAADSANAAAAGASRPKLKSSVVVPSPYDPRSLRQLKKEIKQKVAEKEAASAANSEAEEEEQEEEEEYDYAEGEGVCYEGYTQEGDGELLAAMGALNLGSPEVPLGPYALRGMPQPQGQHIRFDEDGSANVSPGLKVLLRGMPTPYGKHVYFSEDDE